ncbi:hypothetical protein [Streptococcus pyogenes]|uniref:hypothetical protein n=1 Tax=Streptococcus pyogenes TaxID=1314 RepID=UPI0010D3D26C|nr:hypothetical protein [Streptococcus pyogenes]VGQ69580.1 phage protein [Streptococcus pyogenes]VHC81466.1 phage protein [Streptococcus pyogenes]
MKKKLMLAVVLLLSMGTMSVQADDQVVEGNSFTTKGQSRLSGVSVKSFKVGDEQINVHVGSFGYVFASVNDEKIEVPNIKHKVTCDKTKTWIYSPDCYEREWETSGYRAGEDGNYTVKLKKPLEEGDVVTLSFADDGNSFLGRLVYESKKAQNTRLQEEKKVEEQRKAEEEQKQLEDSMIKHIQEEAKKTWYQRLGDSIQDQWWNFKGWLRG